MPADITRISDDIRNGYRGPVMQQGRVILDRDFNALEETLSHAIDADALDIVGPCGTPDDGFAISIPPSSPPPLHPSDFLINPGTMYVGGQRAVFTAPAAGKPPLSYFNQPDWAGPELLALGQGPASHIGSPPGGVLEDNEFVYLHLFEQEVSAVEDPELKDVALGGPDTSQRLRLMRRVKRMGVVATDCATALQQAQSAWSARGLLFDPKTMRLVPQATLQVSFTQAQTTADPCDPTSVGGYLGADNQLIRAQLSDGGNGSGSPVSLLWGYDNASFIHRAAVSADGITVQLNPSPVDAFHSPQVGQVVEILQTAAILASEPDATDPTGVRQIVRGVAETSGFVCAVATAYDPSTGNVVLNKSIPTEYTDHQQPLFLRVWRALLPIPAGGVVELTDPVGQTSAANPVTTGLKVTVLAQNGTLPVGAYWSIAVRPSTPQGVYPESLLVGPQPPDGPRQWVCPLAVIDWEAVASGGASPVQDCRAHFCNLVDLTKRKLGGCCTAYVHPEDASKPGGIQSIIDDAVIGGVPATVCFLPGLYELPQPLRLSSRHSHLKLEGCPEGAILAAAKGAESQFIDGLVVLAQADNVTLQGLTFDLPVVPFLGNNANLAGLDAALLGNINGPSLKSLFVSIGLRPLKCDSLSVRHCIFTFPSFTTQGDALQNAFAVGILSGGGCVGLTIEANQFAGSVQSQTNISAQPFQFQIGYAQSPVSVITKAAVTKQKKTLTKDEITSIVPTTTIRRSAENIVRITPGSNPSTSAAKPSAPTSPATAAAPAAPAVAATPATEVIFDPKLFTAVTLTGDVKLLPSWLQQASIKANQFGSLTVGILLYGETGSLRIQDNEILNSYAGFWLFPRRTPIPAAFSQSSQPELEDVVQDPILVIGGTIARGYPLPSGFSDPSQVSLTCRLTVIVKQPPTSPTLGSLLDEYEILGSQIEANLESQVAQKTSPSTLQGFNFSLQCLGNSVDAQVFGQGLGSSGTGVVIWGDENDTTVTEVLLTANRIRNNGDSEDLGTTTAVIAIVARCAVTGNLILNETPTSQRESLFVSLPANTSALAVTGNIFQGSAVIPTNLQQLNTSIP